MSYKEINVSKSQPFVASYEKCMKERMIIKRFSKSTYNGIKKYIEKRFIIKEDTSATQCTIIINILTIF